jgi:hypothetical protein
VAPCPPGFNTIGRLEDDVRVAQNFNPLTNEEGKALDVRAGSDKVNSIKCPALEY